MNRLKFRLCFISILVLFGTYNTFCITDQKVLQEFVRWAEILGLKSTNMQPVEIYRVVNPTFKQEVVDVFGCGPDRIPYLNLTFNSKTGELIGVYNGYQFHIEESEKTAGKKIIFSLSREICQNQLIRYYRLITGEDPPFFEIEVPVPGAEIPPTYMISTRWQRMYNGYPIRDNYIALSIFAGSGVLASYQKRFISNPPRSVEVRITGDEARQKAIKIADEEIKAWVQFLDSISTETGIQQLKDKNLRRMLKGKSKEIKEESQRYASLIGCKPKEDKPAYLEIVNIQRDAFRRNYMETEGGEKSREWNPATRLSWVVTLYYRNDETKAYAHFEIWIDAYDGSLVGGFRPWD